MRQYLASLKMVSFQTCSSKVFHLSMKYGASSHNVIYLLPPHPKTNMRMHARVRAHTHTHTHTHTSTSGFVQQTLQCQTQNEQKWISPQFSAHHTKRQCNYISCCNTP